eukprot:CAMPEP_0194511570 /NCGR_PEP_ID=MMETSP0253-20130528/43283_1 /TAXON_ID=2966 /ORGANISM="Noctiluca scintillans" /LENGTH=312 /DNA_ID=CAMNT_0039354909 /DNA_START=247 /DNA_END=1185 /DNA_ORIENTATION=-
MNVTTESGDFRGGTVSWVASGMRGWRDNMEDAHVAEMLDPTIFPDSAIFAVLDGHGGAEVSYLASELLVSEVVQCGREQLASGCQAASLEVALEEALPRLDVRLRSGFCGLGRIFKSVHPFASCGSTACVAAVDFAKREVLVANVGDSRSFLVRKGKAINLSEDHKPENAKERSRILAAGGRVVKVGPCHRVDGNLNLSRALGDFDLKSNSELPAEKQKVTAYPDFKKHSFQGGAEEFLVVACDGLFERMSNQDVSDQMWSLVRKGAPLQQVAHQVLHSCCARGINGMPAQDGTDNETVILVSLPAADTSDS